MVNLTLQISFCCRLTFREAGPRNYREVSVNHLYQFKFFLVYNFEKLDFIA